MTAEPREGCWLPTAVVLAAVFALVLFVITRPGVDAWLSRPVTELTVGELVVIVFLAALFAR